MCGYERPRDFLLDVIEAGQGSDITAQLPFDNVDFDAGKELRPVFRFIRPVAWLRPH